MTKVKSETHQTLPPQKMITHHELLHFFFFCLKKTCVTFMGFSQALPSSRPVWLKLKAYLYMLTREEVPWVQRALLRSKQAEVVSGCRGIVWTWLIHGSHWPHKWQPMKRRGGGETWSKPCQIAHFLLLFTARKKRGCGAAAIPNLLWPKPCWSFLQEPRCMGDSTKMHFWWSQVTTRKHQMQLGMLQFQRLHGGRKFHLGNKCLKWK